MKNLIIIILTFTVAYQYGVIYGSESHEDGSQSPIINMDKISYIESSNRPHVVNKQSGAIGQYQITKIALLDFNQINKKEYNCNDLFNPKVNKEVADWLMNKRNVQLLAHYGLENTLHNRLASYNMGARKLRDYVRAGKMLPEETRDYILKYTQLTKGER